MNPNTLITILELCLESPIKTEARSEQETKNLYLDLRGLPEAFEVLPYLHCGWLKYYLVSPCKHTIPYQIHEPNSITNSKTKTFKSKSSYVLSLRY
jgi:hypothetical protein